ncbi:MAG: hypothetical protein GY765_01860 [bacterium]|nr:hypothetical protein [bacterium]
MKVKAFKSKLTLNKKTIAHLSKGGMNGINGGVCDCDCNCDCTCCCPDPITIIPITVDPLVCVTQLKFLCKNTAESICYFCRVDY